MLETKIAMLLVGVILTLAPLSLAGVKLPSFFSDHMVLQRDVKIPIWGLSSPGETIRVKLGNHSFQTKANAQGHWQVLLPAMKVGGPYELVVEGENEKINLSDVYIGDVWIASGQSNMQWPVSASMNAEKEIASANYPLIRLLQVPLKFSKEPQWDIECKWQVCSPQTVKDFSAVAYFFARELQKDLNIPIGIINSSVGGTPAEAWTSMRTLKNLPELGALLELWEKYDEAVSRWNSEGKQGPHPTPPFGLGVEWAEFWRPAGLFNAMIAPFTRFPIKGAIWYQGESNVGRAREYSVLFPAMIEDWRKHWGIKDLPFFFVQLANFMQRHPEPTESGWAELREAQMSALKLPKTGMAVAIDIGDAEDIHPKNKQDVGKRLALSALAIAYDKKLVYSGPMFEKMKVEGDKIRIFFKHTGSGLTYKGDRLKGFAIAGEDKKFKWAEARIEGNTVVVWNPQISHPVVVRYAWADNPDCNLYNKEGLPAVPFRTDIPDYMKDKLP